jgi:hypothetical protein
VDWPRLGAIARQAGIDLNAVLRSPAGDSEREAR